ncbi:type 4 prepilin peptidase 1 Aspartic peptidase, MEROPS family A24A [Candidatus Electrothrix aarhusensis]|uniref:Prepilin leader peptidase/N-methyltransferase n=1 Tax=Candidatus Electrothrix aarhusensis TaxID=1859131 RepID=A0A3S3UAK8_9BACT|nr:type 4 prepilin peptidase 1 Aspartic peptidase, MEROPS family A24A [Candidatus Electrothrix aarhusensis]
METLFLLYSFIFGALIGSFLNVVIFRLPDETQSVVFPASHCPKCGTNLHWYENIPVLSYLALRGKCRTCKVPISLQYPVVELCMALLSLALYNEFGFSLILPFYFLFLAALLVIIFIDIHLQIIPDKISLPGILIGFASSFFNPLVSWQESGLGILLGGGILYAVAKGYLLIAKRDGMGMGDVKLLAMIGAFLGYQCLLYVIFFSSLTGSVVGIAAMFQQKKGGQTRIPFGPFLSLAALSWLFFQEDILAVWSWYLTVSG